MSGGRARNMGVRLFENSAIGMACGGTKERQERVSATGREIVVKKAIVFSVLLLTLCTVMPAGAQIHLGVLGGLNVSSVSIDPWEEEGEWSSRTGFGFGGVFDL